MFIKVGHKELKSSLGNTRIIIKNFIDTLGDKEIK